MWPKTISNNNNNEKHLNGMKENIVNNNDSLLIKWDEGWMQKVSVCMFRMETHTRTHNTVQLLTIILDTHRDR